MLELAPARAGVTSRIVLQGPDVLYVEMDESLSKQTLYVRTDAWDVSSPLEHVETAESGIQRGTVLHAGALRIARRLLDSAIDECGLHRSRGTVVCGFGYGGAVATAMALLLHAQGFPIRNAVAFGSPRLVETVEDRHAMAINALHVSIAGDPLCEVPFSGATGNPMRHIGEALVLASEAVDAKVAEEDTAARDQDRKEADKYEAAVRDYNAEQAAKRRQRVMDRAAAAAVTADKTTVVAAEAEDDMMEDLLALQAASLTDNDAAADVTGGRRAYDDMTHEEREAAEAAARDGDGMGDGPSSGYSEMPVQPFYTMQHYAMAMADERARVDYTEDAESGLGGGGDDRSELPDDGDATAFRQRAVANTPDSTRYGGATPFRYPQEMGTR
jgi:pimeloyl-ACP methyl ester carboxylesterase